MSRKALSLEAVVAASLFMCSLFLFYQPAAFGGDASSVLSETLAQMPEEVEATFLPTGDLY